MIRFPLLLLASWSLPAPLQAAVEQLEQIGVELSRLHTVLEAQRGEGAGGGPTLSPEAARNRLEASFAAEAEIVFTTASSSGRR